MNLAKTANYLSWIVIIILVLIPFHAFFTVSLSALVGHYTLLRLWKEFLLIILLAGGTYLLIKDAKMRRIFTSLLVVRLIILYVLLSIVWAAVAYAMGKVTPKALGFGIIVNLRFLFFFLAVWIIASQSPLLKKSWPKILLIPALAVVLIGLLQRLVLPYDFLKHFGYSAKTIFPYETINHNTNYPRVISTLRGANPLGAYMILVLTAIAGFAFKDKKRRWFWGIFAAVGLMTLVFSYSRSAWIGLILSFVIAGWMSLKTGHIKRIFLPASVILLIVGIFAIVNLRHSATFENIFFHTQSKSTVKTTSDQGHITALKSGLRDVVHEPLGRGVGTAGPASVYNNGNVRISENYFIQIAQEAGWAGMILFIIVNYLIACELWYRRSDLLARVLLASLVGITFINLLSHAWTDDTLAYLWWGLAGVALAPIIVDRQKAHGKKFKAKS
jgi:hypothetical protein